MSNFIFLGNIEFRQFGAKDKTKRKSNLLRNVALGVGGVGLLGAGIYAASKLKSKPNIPIKNTSVSSSSPMVTSSVPKVSTSNTLNTIKDVDNFMLKPRNRLNTSTGYQAKLNNTNRKVKRANKKVKMRVSKPVEAAANTNLTIRRLNDPNYTWKFSRAEFSRRKGSKDKTKRMSRVGAGLRIGTIGTLGAASGAGIGYLLAGAKNPSRAIAGGLTGAAIGGLGFGGASYLEHKKSPYSPVGKKKWRNYPVAPRMYGIPVERLALIKGLDQQ